MEHGYATIRGYGVYTEIKRFERRPRGGRRVGADKGAISNSDTLPLLSVSGEDLKRQREREKTRSEANARSAARFFRHLVGANLVGHPYPVLVSLTYRENCTNLDRAREDFKSFGKRAAVQFGESFKYIAVVEFQDRGAIHFHALCWGIDKKTVKGERRTRLVAGLWGKGFVDVVQTDGSPKLASYLSNYFRETFKDPRLFGRRAYTASRNILRPIYVKDAILAPHFMGLAEPDLSTAHLAQEEEYDTMWLGRCNYQRYLTLEKKYETRS